MEDIKRGQSLSKVQIQKCQKCSQQFCSTITYRRHMRLHRRNLNLVDKDSPTVNRDELQSFWDKLSEEESMEIMSFDEFFVEGVLSSAVYKDLEGQITKARCFLQESYVKAAIALMVTTCLVDKDAEALKYQKLLEEEEDASKRREADILEKKRLKKLRKKEQRGKKKAGVKPDDSPENNGKIMEIPHSTTSSCERIRLEPADSPETNRESMEIPRSTTSSCERICEEPDHSPETNRENMEISHSTTSCCERVNYRSQAPRGGYDSHNYEARPTQKHASKGGKVWVPKPKTGISEGSHTEESHTIIQSQIQDENSPKKDRKRELLIGSISITLDENDRHKDGKRELLIGSTSITLDENDIHEKQQKIELVKDNSAVQLACPEDSHSSGCEYSPNPYEEDGHQGYLRFASHIAQAFLAKRWTEVIESDHVSVALFQEAEPPEVDNQEAEPPEVDNQEAEPPEVDNQEAVPSSNLDS